MRVTSGKVGREAREETPVVLRDKRLWEAKKWGRKRGAEREDGKGSWRKKRARRGGGVPRVWKRRGWARGFPISANPISPASVGAARQSIDFPREIPADSGGRRFSSTVAWSQERNVQHFVRPRRALPRWRQEVTLRDQRQCLWRSVPRPWRCNGCGVGPTQNRVRAASSFTRASIVWRPPALRRFTEKLSTVRLDAAVAKATAFFIAAKSVRLTDAR